jgi:hypothetical protein
MGALRQPSFERSVIDDNRTDGYWIEAFDINNDSKLDLVGYGLNSGEVNWYENPVWKKHRIAQLAGPVGMHHCDIDDDGWMDIVICYEYGASMIDCDPHGGKIIWLQNPRTPDGQWSSHYIGRATAMHRLKVGFFTQSQKLEILALPVVGGPNNIHSLVPVILFRQPDDLSAPEWPETIVDQTNYRVIHGVSVQPRHPRQRSGLHSALIASEQGISWLYYHDETKAWMREIIGTGESCQASRTGYKGTGDVDMGRIGGNERAYIAAVEPFHGNTVAIYHRGQGTTDIGAPWTRHVLDVFGDPNPMGEGCGHFVVRGDFDNDGDDEFLVALRGPYPWQGVFYYKAVDVSSGAFVKWRVSSDSAARIAVGDYDGDGRLDFATISYSVEGYFCAENPKIVLFRNTFADIDPRSAL